MEKPVIRFWDMDHTLLDNDCDVSWKLFLIGKKIAPEDDLALMEKFWKQYEEGRLDPESFNAFQLREFIDRTPGEMKPLAREHFESHIKSRAYPRALTMVREQQKAGDVTCMITATNGVVSTPVAEFFGFEHFISTSLELAGGRYTGRIAGRYCVGEGKIAYMEEFCARFNISISQVYYYGDSVADIPVFKAVGHPVAVNPMPPLRELAGKSGWPVIDMSP
jgi:HAD superfamily hydrolase (TIGR01490 family)